MSSDPYRSDNAPFEEGPSGPEGYGPESGSPPPGDRGRARERVQLPATFLIVTGVVNLLGSCVLFFIALQAALMPAQELYNQSIQSYSNIPAVQQSMAKTTPDQLKTQAVGMYSIGGGVVFLAAVLTILGGVSMLRLRAYALGILGSLAAAIPCISCLGCCGAGEAIGLWALIVLMNEEVRSTFP